MTTALVPEEQQESLKEFGFWLYLITDVILFATLFATYAVLRNNTAGGLSAIEFIRLPVITAATFILLTGSFTGGLANLAMQRDRLGLGIGWLAVTVMLGASFIVLEVWEFLHMARKGATMQASAFLSAFYTLVGTHGAHISFGLVWTAAVIFQLYWRGIMPVTKRKASVICLFWHFLNAVWIFIFSVVYLMGVM